MFHFEQSCAVRKYDAHNFFQGFSGVGLKGVDFIVLYEDLLLLIEGKNYRRRQDWQTENPFDPIQAAPESFADDIADKYLDTLSALQAIGTYYSRKWWFGLLNPVRSYLPGKYLDWVFWSKIHHHLLEHKSVVSILFLESENDQRTFRQTLQGHLNKRLQGKVKETLILTAIDENRFDGIRVTPTEPT